jgi:hypothetical protein
MPEFLPIRRFRPPVIRLLPPAIRLFDVLYLAVPIAIIGRKSWNLNHLVLIFFRCARACARALRRGTLWQLARSPGERRQVGVGAARRSAAIASGGGSTVG